MNHETSICLDGLTLYLCFEGRRVSLTVARLPAPTAFFPGVSFSARYLFLFIDPGQVPQVHLSSFRGPLSSRLQYRH